MSAAESSQPHSGSPPVLGLDRLTPSDLAAFTRFGVRAELLAQAHVQRVTDRAAREIYGITGPVIRDMSGIVFPYCSPVTGKRVTARVRRDNPEIEQGRPKNKYISAYGDRKHLYFLPGAAEKLRDPDTVIVLVESEKAVLAMTAWAERMGATTLAVGLGGCWGWRGRIGKLENEHGERVDEMGPIEDLNLLGNHTVYVMLDANVTSNPRVRQAQNALVAELRKRNCGIGLCNLPAVDGVNGPDDYIRICGDDAMREVIDTRNHRPDKRRRAEIVKLADVQAREVDWLWRPYLPAGMLAMLSGDPGAGKTFLALAIAAALTTGRVPCSGERCQPINVLYLTVENDAECVMRPRFDDLGGNPESLHLVRGSVLTVDDTVERSAIWLTDVPSLADALSRTEARLMIVDPIQSYLGAEVDAHRANETRPIMDGLVRLADAHRCCMLLLRHLGKAQSSRAIHRGLGSIDLTGAVRCEMLAGSPPADPQTRAIVQIKNNLSAYGPALGYTIDETGKFSWTGASTVTQADILASESSGKESALNEAVEFLREQLANGARPTKEIQEAARTQGISWRTVERAKKDAGVTSRPDGFAQHWVLELHSPPTMPIVRQDQVLADSVKLGGVWDGVTSQKNETAEAGSKGSDYVDLVL